MILEFTFLLPALIRLKFTSIKMVWLALQRESTKQREKRINLFTLQILVSINTLKILFKTKNPITLRKSILQNGH